MNCIKLPTYPVHMFYAFLNLTKEYTLRNTKAIKGYNWMWHKRILLYVNTCTYIWDVIPFTFFILPVNLFQNTNNLCTNCEKGDCVPSGVPILPMNVFANARWVISGSAATTIGVSMMPGRMILQRMGIFAHSLAAVLERAIIPALHAAYTPVASALPCQLQMYIYEQRMLVLLMKMFM